MTKETRTFEFDEDEWYFIWNSINMYSDLNDSTKERLGHELWVDYEKESYKRLLEGKFGNP